MAHIPCDIEWANPSLAPLPWPNRLGWLIWQGRRTMRHPSPSPKSVIPWLAEPGWSGFGGGALLPECWANTVSFPPFFFYPFFARCFLCGWSCKHGRNEHPKPAKSKITFSRAICECECHAGMAGWELGSDVATFDIFQARLQAAQIFILDTAERLRLQAVSLRVPLECPFASPHKSPNSPGQRKRTRGSSELGMPMSSWHLPGLWPIFSSWIHLCKLMQF